MTHRSPSKWQIACASLLLAISSLAADTLIPDSAPNWKSKTDGSDQGTAWKTASFDDSTWTLGTASFGYGDPSTTVVTANKITYYFRKTFTVADPAAYTALTLRMNYDDGFAVYINGTEVKRVGIAAGATYTSTAANHESGAWETFSIPAGTLVAGSNVIAVEVHNQAASSSDLFFNLGLVGETSPQLARVPYLQMGGPDRMTVRWRTNIPVIGRVRYGTTQGALNLTASESAATTEHEVTLTGLTSQTKYFYAVGDAVNGDLAGNTANHHFETSPAIGADVPTRVWVIGDAGTNDANQTAVFNAFKARSAGTYTDLMIMLGDNAYNNGTDALAQNAVFNMYADILRQTPAWSCIGNHENDYDSGGVGYYQYMSLPKQARSDGLSSGVNSGTEAYYSFDHGQIHFICLDSASSQDYTTAGAMYKWAEQDLQQNTGKFVIAFWHHPPYTKGSHNSDTESRLITMRSTFLPLFEQYGVDLVLNGHSHSYERSKFIDGHYGLSSTFNPALKSAGGHVVQSGSGDDSSPYLKPATRSARSGVVYNLAGSSGKISGGTLDHPAMEKSLNVLGSVLITVSGDTLHADFIDSTNTIRDTYVIKKSAANQAPVASPQNVSTSEDSAQAIALSATDAEATALTYSIVSQPAHGTLSGSGANWTYTPAANYNGPDSFTFKANDGSLDSNVATVSLTVNPVNDAPVAVDQALNTAANTAVALVLSANDADGDALSYAIVTQPAHGTLSGSGSSWTYTPANGYSGTDSFTFKANDGTIDSNLATVTVTTAPPVIVNSAPVASNSSASTNEDTAVALVLAATDVDGNPLTYSIVSQPTKGTLSGSGANWTYTPATNTNGPDSFTFKANDGSLDSNVATVSLTVNPVNDAPVANGQSIAATEDTAKTLVLGATDVDGNALTYTIVAAPTKGTLSGTAPNLTYTPNANYNGADSFTFKANDGTVDSNVATVSLSIAAVNDAPVAKALGYATSQDTAKAVTLSATDVEGSALTYTLVASPLHGSLSGSGSALTYTPALGYVGTDSFTYKANDGTVDSAVATVSFSITPADGQLLYYKLNEGSGTVATDSSAFARNGTLTNGPIWITGQEGSAVNLDGVDDQVTGPTLNLTTNVMTMCGWVKRNGAQVDYAGLIFCRGGTTVSGLDIKATGELRYHWNDRSATYSFASGLIIPDQTWTFVAIAVEPTKATLVMRPAGGTLSSAVNTVAHDVDEFNSSLLLGRDTSGSRRFKGAIDEVRVYSRTLSLAELTTLSNLGAPAAMKAQTLAKTATKPVKAKLSPSRAVFLADETLSFDYAGLPGKASDWLAVYPKGANDLSFLGQVNLGKTSGKAVIAGLSLADGDYEARVFANGTFSLLAKTSFRVQSEFRLERLVSNAAAQRHGLGLALPGGDFWQAQAGDTGLISATLAEGLRAGDYLASVELQHQALPGTVLGTLQVVQDGRVIASVEVLAEAYPKAKAQLSTLPFNLDPSGDVELLFLSSGKAAVATGTMSLLPVEKP
ncbi:MAG: hypothetical protein RL095_828 [Verrucomicrobiota bacterium]|jgi:hypothetical protein